MSIYEYLDLALLLCSLPILFLYVKYGLRYTQAVNGSHEKYVASTMCLGTSASLALIDFGRAFSYVGMEKHFLAGLSTTVALMWLLLAYGYSKNDNWFNNQFKKLKCKIKNFARSLAPSPRLAPAYAR